MLQLHRKQIAAGASPYGQGNYLAMSKSLLETLKLSSTCAQIENAKEAIVNHTALSC